MKQETKNTLIIGAITCILISIISFLVITAQLKGYKEVIDKQIDDCIKSGGLTYIADCYCPALIAFLSGENCDECMDTAGSGCVYKNGTRIKFYVNLIN